MKSKFKIVKGSDYFEVVNQDGITFRFSQEVGIPVAIGALVKKSVANYLLSFDYWNYEYEFLMTEKK